MLYARVKFLELAVMALIGVLEFRDCKFIGVFLTSAGCYHCSCSSAGFLLKKHELVILREKDIGVDFGVELLIPFVKELISSIERGHVHGRGFRGHHHSEDCGQVIFVLTVGCRVIDTRWFDGILWWLGLWWLMLGWGGMWYFKAVTSVIRVGWCVGLLYGWWWVVAVRWLSCVQVNAGFEHESELGSLLSLLFCVDRAPSTCGRGEACCWIGDFMIVGSSPR